MKPFFMLNSAEHETCLFVKLKLLTNCFLPNIVEMKISLLIDMKMPTTVLLLEFSY